MHMVVFHDWFVHNGARLQRRFFTILRPGFPVENVDPIDADGVIGRRGGNGGNGLAGYAFEAKTRCTGGGYEHSIFHLGGSPIALLRRSAARVFILAKNSQRSPRSQTTTFSSSMNRAAM